MQINQSINSLIIPSHRAMVSFNVISTDNRLPVRQAQETFLVSIASGLDLGLNPYSVQWVPRLVFPGVKRRGRKADHHFHLVPK